MSRKKPARRKPPQPYGSWGAVRHNVDYEGCFGDAAYHNRELEDNKYYNTTGDPNWEYKGPFLSDPNIPRHGQRKFPHLLDGPARLIPSLEKITSRRFNPLSLQLHQALRRCYEKAKKRGKRYFALTNGGMCMATADDMFKAWGKLDPKECKACLKQCKKGKPCGQVCVHKRRKCAKKVHQTCAHDDKHTIMKGHKSGGFFTNAVYKIKDLNMPSPEEEAEEKTPEPDEDHADLWKDFRYARPDPAQGLLCPTYPGGFYPLSETQKFSLEYFTPDNPIKGYIVNHSAGSGKTALAMNVAGHFMDAGWEMLWVTRQAIKDVPEKTIYQEAGLLSLRAIIENKKPLYRKDGKTPILQPNEKPIVTPQEKMEFINTARGKQALAVGYGIRFYQYRVMTYDEFVKLIVGATQELRSRRTVFQQKSSNDDWLQKTLIIFDEAHNLISDGLNADEREFLDRTFPQHPMKTVADVYGPLPYAHDPQHPVQGRDLIAAQLYHSFEQSGPFSAKTLLLSGTPMNTSPADLFWLMNLTLEDPAARLSLNVADYYDQDTGAVQLRDEMVLRFAAAAHGRLSYFNAALNPNRFALKVFYDKVQVDLQKFHTDSLLAEVKAAEAQGANWTEKVAIYRNKSLAAKAKGAVFSPQVIKKFKRSLERLQNGWTPEGERQHQTELYEAGAPEATSVFKLGITPVDLQRYEKKRVAYEKWAPKMNAWLAASRARAKNGPDMPRSIRDVVDEHGNLIPLEEWVDEAAEVQRDIEISAADRKEYAKLSKRQQAYASKVVQFDHGALKRRPRRPDLKQLIGEDGQVRELKAFVAARMGGGTVKKGSAEYHQRKEALQQYRQELDAWKRGSWVPQHMEPRPIPPKGIADMLDDNGGLLTPAQWFGRHLAKKRYKKPKKRYTKKESALLSFLIEDPQTSRMRLKTLEEFVDVRKPDVTLSGQEDRTGVSFLMWHSKFDARLTVELMPFYMPKIHEVIEKIVSIEHKAQQTFRRPFKHTVFTFSVAGKKGDAANYGARILASAFRAREDKFYVCLAYKRQKDSQGKEHVYLDTSQIPPGRWGVAVLSSRPIPHVNQIYGQNLGGNLDVKFNKTIINATTRAFNAPDNKYGEKIKVLLMDGAFTEGVGAYDPCVAHILNPGLSRSNLEQAAARSTRNCKSQNVPFFKNMGSFLEMYFYEDQLHGEVDTLYQRMLSEIPPQVQTNFNLIDNFQRLSAQFSIDYWLNHQINEFDQVVTGRIVEYYDKYDMSYLVEKQLHWSDPQTDKKRSSQAHTIAYRFIVGLKDVVRPGFAPGDRVTDVQGRSGQVIKYHSSTQTYQVRYGTDEVKYEATRKVRYGADGHTKSHSKSGAIHEQQPLAQLRHAIGTTLTFRLPYAVDMAQRVMNIGNYRLYHSDDTEAAMVRNLEIPANALDAVYTSFRGNTQSRILGLIALFKMVILSGGVGVPVHVVVPPIADDLPASSSYAMQWFCGNGGGERELMISDELLTDFLGPTEGISLMFLDLLDTRCGVKAAAGPSHANLLIYVPQWGTIERFDPMGYRPHRYDAIKLDARLYDLFTGQDMALHYMSSAETNLHVGFQLMQHREKKRHRLDPNDFSGAFTLLYMHMRILYAAQMLRDHPKERRRVYPVQFQRGLMQAMRQVFGGQMTAYIRTYAENVKHARFWVRDWDQSDMDAPFWSNAVEFLHFLLRDMSHRHTSRADGDAHYQVAASRKRNKREMVERITSNWSKFPWWPSPKTRAPATTSLFEKFKTMTQLLW